MGIVIVIFFNLRFVFEDQIDFIKASIMDGDNVCGAFLTFMTRIIEMIFVGTTLLIVIICAV